MDEPLPDGDGRRRPNSDTPNSSNHLLARAQAGDRQALEELLARYLPGLRRWAAGRAPGSVRDKQRDACVQDTLVRAFTTNGGTPPRRDGTLHARLRLAVQTRLAAEFRAPGAARSPGAVSLFEQTVGVERAARYEAALSRLRDEEREAIIVRLELGCSYEDAAAALDLPSADDARALAARAIVRLAEEMTRVS